MNSIRIALAGNPNSGKTTLFNALTGSRHRVGNWPGVTVERIDGDYEHDGTRVDVTDLPGIYSFSAYSIDETIARRHILTDRPDLVVNIVDATNLERNLYLTTQLLEMRVPVVVALSMVDVARRRRMKIEIQHLARHLGCPVVPIDAPRKSGMDELRAAIEATARETAVSATHVAYDTELEKGIEKIRSLVSGRAATSGVDARWLAIKVFEQDEIADEITDGLDIAAVVDAETERIRKHIGEDLDIVIADGRYGFIHGLAVDVVKRDVEMRRTVSDSIDKVLLNRVLGIPAFLAIMYGVFALTMNVGGFFIGLFERICGMVFVDAFGSLLTAAGSPRWLVVFLADGIGGGIQTVATFVPPIFFIFLCLAFLEDSGYMARAAFVMDRMLRAVGLPGKAFIPMLVGFGCNVPAILATRTLENNRDRILTVLMNPFMSCGARLPVYALFVVAFFPDRGGIVLFGLYLTGIVLAILTGLLLKQTILQGEPATFVMELPPYHVPTVRGILYHTWHRLKTFILRAGKVILAAVVILTLLNAVGTDGSLGQQDAGQSLLSGMGRAMVPVFRPLGITRDNWPGAVGLVSGLFAKEAVIGTLGTLYAQMEGAVSSEQTTVAGLLRYFDGRIGAIAYLLFVLIYSPCVAVIAAIHRETNARWAAFSVAYQTFLAWATATIVYQVGTFARHPASSGAWVAACLAFSAVFCVALRLGSRTMPVKA
ncbi:MAG: ferrous iron transport protein B [Lentisphaerae bacterium]|nr:ferrous iron transport protein B [Lentisphaerota bacterium]